MNKVFKVVDKQNLFFGKFLYKASFTSELLHCTRYAKTVKELENVLLNRVRDHITVFVPVDAAANKVHFPSNKSFLDSFTIWKTINHGPDCMVRIDYRTGSVYSNDLNKLAELETLCKFNNPKVKYTKINLLPNSDVLFRKNPKHKYRVYLRSKNISLDTHDEIAEFLNRHKNTFYPCSALNVWLNATDKKIRYWRYRYCSAAFFIDYDNEADETLLRLSMNDYLGKVYKIQRKV